MLSYITTTTPKAMSKTIEVSGVAKLERKISKYRAKISIEVNQNPYGDEEVSNLEGIKN